MHNYTDTPPITSTEDGDRFRTIIEKSLDAVVLFGADGAVKYATPSSARLMGYDPAALAGTDGFERVHSDDRDRVRAAFVTGLAAPDSTLTETYRVRHKDGGWRWLEARAVNLLAEPSVEAVVVTYRDVTQQREVEDAHRASEALLRTVIGNIPCGVFWKDRTSVYLGCNDLFARNFGLDGPGAVVGRTDFDLGAAPAEAELFRACDRQVMEGGEPLLGIEEALTRLDGSRTVLLTSKVPLRDAAGAVVGVLGVYQDITERKRVEDEVGEWKARYEAAVKSTGQVLYDWDAATDRLAWGGSCEPTLGYCEAEMPPELAGLVELVHPEDRAVFEREAERVASSGVPFRLEYRVRRKDGVYIVVDDHGHFVPSLSGRSTRMVGFVADVTERRRLEEQLRQAQKMEAVGQLAGGVAHDFNNLLTIINGYSDIILATLHHHDVARPMVEEVKKAGERAAELTQQMLAFGRQQILQSKVLDLNEVVAGVGDMLRRLIGEDVGLVFRRGPDLLRVKADPGQVGQVLMNLAVNARDAMPTGGTLTVETRNVVLEAGTAADGADVRPGPYVLLAVSDTGTGIPEEARQHIFEPFFTTKEVGKGTGLGLATVYGIVKQSGGHVEVATAVGKGSTFGVYLPGIGDSAPSEKAVGGRAPRGAELVLLVEDEAAVRRMAELALRAQGYAVLTAGNAGEALAAAAGSELAERLLADRPRLKVLYMSGYTDDAVVRHGVVSERVNFLQKPFTPASLARKVREVLDAGPSFRD